MPHHTAEPTAARARAFRVVFPRSALLLAFALLVPAPAPAAVLVELFTSQGCSSCPPADRLLARLGSEPGLSGQVVPLAFHVDYWNWIGWRDPFSAAAWSQRQRGYASAWRSRRVYTPQAVVGGRRDCNGGDLRCIRAAVQALSPQPAGEVKLAFTAAQATVPAPPSTAQSTALRLAVSARAPAGAGAVDVMLAVFEKGLETAVGRGENAQKTLRNEYVVRRLQRAFQLSGPAARREVVAVSLDPTWRRRNLGIAVFLQDPRTRQTFAATSSAVPAR